MDPLSMAATAGQVFKTVAPFVGDTFRNVGGAGRGNVAGRAATAGSNHQDILDEAERRGISMDQLGEAVSQRAQNRSQNETKFQQGIGMENQAFGRQLNADQMRQQTYNSMAMNEQQNRANMAQGLLQDYAQARNAAGNLMANTLSFR